MTKELAALNSIIAVIGAVIARELGGWDMLLVVLVSMTVTDYITGIAVAIVEKRLSSEVGFKGLFKKMMIFALVYMSVLLDKAAGTDMIRTLAIMFYIANEGISILENAGKLGVPYPDTLKNTLVQLKKSSETSDMAKDSGGNA